MQSDYKSLVLWLSILCSFYHCLPSSGSMSGIFKNFFLYSSSSFEYKNVEGSTRKIILVINKIVVKRWIENVIDNNIINDHID